MDNGLTYENKDGIHTFVWHKSNRDVVDLFVKQLENIIQADGVIRYIFVDFVESGLPPARYTVNTINTWQRRHKRTEQTALAIIHRSKGTDSIIFRALIPAMTRKLQSNIRYFTEKERDQALAWLQEEKIEMET